MGAGGITATTESSGYRTPDSEAHTRRSIIGSVLTQILRSCQIGLSTWWSGFVLQRTEPNAFDNDRRTDRCPV